MIEDSQMIAGILIRKYNLDQLLKKQNSPIKLIRWQMFVLVVSVIAEIVLSIIIVIQVDHQSCAIRGVPRVVLTLYQAR